jgi:glycosyltransferase involved in cell wall biosynthesis
VREALSAGVPAVVYTLPPFDDLLGHPCLFAVPLGNIQALAEAFVRTLSLTSAERIRLSDRSSSYPVGPTWSEAAARELEIMLACAD